MTTPDDAGAAADQAHSPAMVRADLLTAIVFIVLAAAVTSGAAGRVGMVLVLTLTYTLGLVGLVPFWLATGLFVFAFILVFEIWLAEPRRRLAQSLPWALGLAIATAAIVTLVFERAFLVRLP